MFKKNVFIRLLNSWKKLSLTKDLRKKKGAVGISKPYFEAIAVGLFLALQENPDLRAENKEELKINKNVRTDFLNLIDGRYHTHNCCKDLRIV